MEPAAQDEVAHQEDHLPNDKDCSLVAADSSEPSAASCQQCCSFAVTGKDEAFQAIYVCYTCCEFSSNVACVCQACADACHADHDGLEYIGMGPSYCDCHSMVEADGKPVCHIVQASEDEAQRLHLAVHGGLPNQPTSAESLSSSYRMESYAIPELDDESQASYLCDLALELVRHSKETFWIEPSDDKSLYCDLERLACAIYNKHASNAQFSGAEWWVQVKLVASRATSEEAVDMHYDKDEQVAETFGLGCFPLLSTVTYLTGRGIESKQSLTVPAQAPTLVLSRKYDDIAGDAGTSVLFLSHPRRGKHILFDGRLLHGAPAHMALRERRTTTVAHSREPSSHDPATKHHRVTFLVNLWSGHKPAGVSPLPDVIRQALHTVQTRAAADDTHASSGSTSSVQGSLPAVGNGFCDLDFQTLPVLERSVTAADVLPDRRLHLPFVGKSATWGVEDDDDERELVVSMSVPPLDGVDDTVLFRFVDPAIGPSLISPSESDHED